VACCAASLFGEAINPVGLGGAGWLGLAGIRLPRPCPLRCCKQPCWLEGPSTLGVEAWRPWRTLECLGPPWPMAVAPVLCQLWHGPKAIPWRSTARHMLIGKLFLCWEDSRDATVLDPGGRARFWHGLWRPQSHLGAEMTYASLSWQRPGLLAFLSWFSLRPGVYHKSQSFYDGSPTLQNARRRFNLPRRR